MKTGRHFSIPERPAELRELWRSAARLDAATLPDWLDPDDAAGYRSLGSVSLAGLSAAEREAMEAEFAELELARLIVDEDPLDADRLHVFVREPECEPIWSIGLRAGSSPWSLTAVGDDRPVVTAADVGDVPASSVADPFLLQTAGRWHMFFEVVNWRSWKGEIGLATSDDGRSWRYEQIVLEEPFHLSYPQVFAADGEIWMIPETSQEETVRLYRARRFPAEWEHVADLLTGWPYADATIARYGDRWWLFAETSGGANDTLRLFGADAIVGPWREHPASPVVRGDATIARPAGRIVWADGRLVRFAQNCGPAYGTDVRAVEITALTADAYVERPLLPGPVLGPAGRGWNAGGMHHVDPVRLDDGTWLVAVDGWQLPDSHDDGPA